MSGKSVEILCTACGRESLLRREPAYDGLRKVGETLSCLACGHVYPGEADVPFKARQASAVFSEQDRSLPVTIFQSDEKGRNCRHCAHYVVNPFVQRCGLHRREVQATDCCDRFEPKQSEG
jgi:uncharacterized Zn finger protein